MNENEKVLGTLGKNFILLQDSTPNHLKKIKVHIEVSVNCEGKYRCLSSVNSRITHLTKSESRAVSHKKHFFVEEPVFTMLRSGDSETIGLAYHILRNKFNRS